jgi:hypothetical protein
MRDSSTPTKDFGDLKSDFANPKSEPPSETWTQVSISNFFPKTISPSSGASPAPLTMTATPPESHTLGVCGYARSSFTLQMFGNVRLYIGGQINRDKLQFECRISGFT